MPDLLLELFSEEIPARMQERAAGDLRKRVTDALVDAGLTYEGAKEYWTPRRLTLDIRGLSAASQAVRDERKGPRTDAPEKAIEGFLRGAGLSSVDQAEVRTDPKKGDFYVAVVEKPGRDAEAIIAEIMPPIIRGFPWPNSMRWGEASREPGSLRWVRPLQSILCTFGPETEEPEVVPFEVDGVKAGNITRGHRFMAPDEIRVKRFEDYAAKLEAAFVRIDAAQRREIIASDAKNLAFAQGFELVEDEGLLAEVANLVEWPVVLMGEFGEDFLAIPDEVIRLTIRENQKCFVLRGGDGKLINRFLLTSNVEAKDGGKEIARGNAKVVNARLSDAKFFWDSDLQQAKSEDGFARWVAGLDNVTFHAKLGSQGERVKRIMALARELAPIVARSHAGKGVEEAPGRPGRARAADAHASGLSEETLSQKAERAAFLAKADLQSAMVFEFPELQGRMGRLYAEAVNEEASVSAAIEEHYKPLGPSDDVPSDPVSVTVALADKLDTLVGFWAIDEKPTGSKDPYALRRAALGVIRLVLENEISLRYSSDDGVQALSAFISGHLGEVMASNYIRETVAQLDEVRELELSQFLDEGTHREAIEKYFSGKAREQFVEMSEPMAAKAEQELISFLHDRLKVYLRDQGIRHDLIDAVLFETISPARGKNQAANDDLLLITRKARALQALIDSEEGTNLLAGYKRAANILAAEEKKGADISATVDPDLLETDEERALLETLGDVENLAGKAIEAEDFEGAMSRLATLRAPIDNFFENVMVNADNEKVRANRLALLARIRAAAATVADLSKISG